MQKPFLSREIPIFPKDRKIQIDNLDYSSQGNQDPNIRKYFQGNAFRALTYFSRKNAQIEKVLSPSNKH